MHKHNRQHRCPDIGSRSSAAKVTTRTCPLAPPRSTSRPLLVATLLLMSLAVPAFAGSVINNATTGAAGTTVTCSHSAATKLLNANTTRYGWTVYCAGTAGTIAALMMPGDSANNAASPAPSQTVGFPIPANTLVSNQDFPLRGLDAIHQRIDAEAQGGADVSCYTWEEQ